MEFEIIQRDQQSNFEEFTAIKIASKKELAKVYETLNSTRFPGYELPEIDFRMYDAFFYCPGVFNSGGYAVDIEKVTRLKEGIEAIIRLTSPGPNSFVTDVITSPFILIKLAKTALPISVKSFSDNQ